LLHCFAGPLNKTQKTANAHCLARWRVKKSKTACACELNSGSLPRPLSIGTGNIALAAACLKLDEVERQRLEVSENTIHARI